ncbi:phage tail tape measure protein [Desulfofundulus sp. TPOSR]|uniref:phage tail tape measure protein n=1 Tax=Desulfofundulus sp. TPOSR TaxID=2714340 RepID=UPI0014099DE3|nr:phage tail tape measure protein [Desulfofundulus sp. TPOSR]NHM25465.1 phage tail tape measure protein [Desulfofundulus sp. TPOSR]NHM27053.1 phage tail tape measure protein [Desulfofundulus sp. TPOSR]
MDSLYNLSVIVSVVDKLTGPVKKMAETFQNFEKTVQKARGMIDFGQRMAVSGALVQGAADTMVRALGNILTPTVENQRALGELASLGIENLDALSEAARRFSSRWAGTTTAQFISAAYDIKSGIASLSDEAVAQFTIMAALTAKATKATTAEMTSLFATGYGIFKDLYANLSDFEFGEMFSAGIAASVQAFKTTGSQMAQALTTLGASASMARRPFEEQLAVLGMLQATMPGGEAGTRYRAFIKAAAQAGKSLGLSFVDSNNQLLGMADILDKLRSKYGETLDAIEKQEIQKAFGTEEAVALIDLLYGKVGQLRSNIDQLGMSMRQGTAFTEKMARAMNQDLGAQFQLLRQNIDILKGSIGDELAPLIKAFIPTVQGWVEGFQRLARSHPTLVRTALLIAAIATAALVVIAPILTVGAGIVMMAGYFIWGLAQIRKAFISLRDVAFRSIATIRTGLHLLRIAISALSSRLILLAERAALTAAGAIYLTARHIAGLAKSAMVAATSALPRLIATVWRFTAVLIANPITWVVLAVAGLGAALYALWRNWDTVTAFLGRTWEALKNKFAGAGQWFSGVFQGIIAAARQYGPLVLAALAPVIGVPLLIAQHWGTIKDVAGRVFGQLVQLLPQWLTQIIAAIRAKAAEFTASGQALIQAFTQGIRNMINAPAEVVKSGLARLRRLLPFSDAKEGPLSTLTRSGMALVETFAGGITARSGLLKTAAAAVLAGITLAAPANALALPVQIDPVLGAVPELPALSTRSLMPDGGYRVNLREIIRESVKERETVREAGRPVIIVVDGGRSGARDDFSDLIDLAYRYLSMSGD